MMSSDIFTSRSSQELLLYLKVHTQINFQGFFLDKSLFNFQGATHSFRECLNTISHRSSIVNTFFRLFYSLFSTCPGVLRVKGFYWVYRNAMGYCFIVLLFYCFITFSLLFVGLVLVVFVSDLSVVFALSRFNFLLIRC